MLDRICVGGFPSRTLPNRRCDWMSKVLQILNLISCVFVKKTGQYSTPSFDPLHVIQSGKRAPSIANLLIKNPAPEKRFNLKAFTGVERKNIFHLSHDSNCPAHSLSKHFSCSILAVVPMIQFVELINDIKQCLPERVQRSCNECECDPQIYSTQGV